MEQKREMRLRPGAHIGDESTFHLAHFDLFSEYTLTHDIITKEMFSVLVLKSKSQHSFLQRNLLCHSQHGISLEPS